MKAGQLLEMVIGELLVPEKGHSPEMNRGTCENGMGHLLQRKMCTCQRKKDSHMRF